MKKSSIYSILLSFALITSWSNPICSQELTQIECELEPIIRLYSRQSLEEKDLHSRERMPWYTIENLLRSHIKISEGNSSSTNWAGYAAVSSLQDPAKKSVTAVSGSWTIPALVASASPKTFSSIWIGIDGYASSTVEQIGTEQNINNGVQKNFAWFEMYPNVLYKIKGFPVNIGDAISASVTFKGTNKKGKSIFLLTITNVTRGVTYTVPKNFSKTKKADRSSAEWIAEAPSSKKGVLPLANFQTIVFTNCSATINGITGSINNPNWEDDSITMVTEDNIVKAIPSNLSVDGKSFSVTWQHE